ncbi:PhoX family protein [Extensimonas perlucida]|uniref:PhoX family protein n=1 Tax=Extensimonas perlucida TaxID=2590786 RepID=UPI00119E8B88|nr:alkaline phosphatase PhoX [Extensimonas perlucida]
MSAHPLPSRRKALQVLAGAPLLPLGTGAMASLLTGCGGDDDDPSYVSAAFTSMAAPTLANAAAMATTTVASTLQVKFSDQSTRDYTLSYQPFFITGDMVPDGKGGTILAGGYYDINNKPIMDTTGSTPRQFFSDCPDGMSLLTVPNAKVDGVKGKPVFAVVQFEYTSWAQDGKTDMYGKLPSPIAVLTLDQDPNTGKLSLVKYHNVDTSGANGLWITCGASLSPWGTHLSSEEYEPDAFAARDRNNMDAYSLNLYGDATKANPYLYGHLPEVTVNPDGTGSIKKHYCTGRISKELVQVMPDERTILCGDDWTNGGLFMFVADKARDLSAGSLYVAKWTQTSSAGAGSGTLTWIKLGSATSADIETMAKTLKPTDIMDVKTADPLDATYTKINYSGTFNWVKLKPGMEKAAAFLETHRYAALMGASMGFTKMEGTTLNVKDKIAYSAMSRLEASMVKGHAAAQAGSIELDKQIRAGAVYALNLKSAIKDTKGAAINSDWVPVDMAAPAALVGEDLATPDALGNTANPDKISNPDNLKFSEKMRTLFIGEDSGQHVNNFLWAYNVDTKTLSRVMSVPAGGESTGLQAVDEINGWTYITSNFQHPGDWGGIHNVVQPVLDPLIRANYKDRYGAAVGYLTATPTQPKLSW